MYQSAELKTHLETSSTIKTQSLVLAEWNLNISSNILEIGNYRNRPGTTGQTFSTPSAFFKKETSTTSPAFYYGATEYDVVVGSGFENNGTPSFLQTVEERSKYLFSLEDCFGKFRPRSGINKMTYNPLGYLPNYSTQSFQRPRYYPADKSDKFKYWTSFRKEAVGTVAEERGVSFGNTAPFYIYDAAPFVVYENPVFANKIVIKMQTHVGSIDQGPFVNSSNVEYDDPFYEDGTGTTQATPKKWKVEYLNTQERTEGSEEYNWETAYEFDETELPPVDGYVELRYGVSNIPSTYSSNFLHVATYSSTTPIPEQSVLGYAYLVQSGNDVGTYYIYNGGENFGESYLDNYDAFVPQYGWLPASQSISDQTPLVTELTNPTSFIGEGSQTFYRELQRIKGLRIVVNEMTKKNATFDLIELSPRLSVNITDRVEGYNFTKTASDVGITGLPIGQLLASIGSISIFDYDQAFNTNNAYDVSTNPDGSIISDLASHDIQFKFYQIVLDVDGANYYIPQKTYFSEGFPRSSIANRQLSIKLRDSLFRFEQTSAPELILVDASLTYILCCLLDAVGFSNYKFYRMPTDDDEIIPYFFTSPEQTLAQTLEDLARSTQTAMFFDENNDFVVMTKNYLLPPEAESGRGSVDVTLTGNSGGSTLPNIAEIASETNDVFNDGSISYNVKYIAKKNRKSNKGLQTESKWVYAVTPLWSIQGESTTTAENEASGANQGLYSLMAVPLNTTLNNQPPYIEGGEVKNNTLDFGESIFWQKDNRYKGYFYANGEIIRYDAIQYAYKGSAATAAETTVWVSSLDEYKNVFSKIPFNGKLYATGLVRIFTELNSAGEIVKHGRGQFGTKIVSHSAGLSSEWSSATNVHGMKMNAALLFEGVTDGVSIVEGASGKQFDSTTSSDVKAQNDSRRNGIIRNNLSTFAPEEKQIVSATKTEPGVIQSSALVFNGPNFEPSESPKDFVSYVFKDLGETYSHVGTRMRIIGKPAYKQENSTDAYQGAYGSMPYFSAEATGGTLPTIGGGGGGLAVMVNPENNTGYFFELAALSVDNIKDFNVSDVANVFFYKTHRNLTATSDNDASVPVPLWKGLYGINVNTGNDYGSNRNVNTENTTVYDIAIDWETITVGNKTSYRFYLHINGKIVAVVDDTNVVGPMQTNNVAMFVRGSSECMFENIYAISANEAKIDNQVTVPAGVSKKISKSTRGELSSQQVGDVFGINSIVEETFLSGLSSGGSPDYKIFYDEFGTIMRECAYFDVRFQDAYPALLAKLNETTESGYKQYKVSGFRYHPYGAEFLVFNTSDRGISLGDGTGNILTITGVTFTRQSENKLTVDEFFSKKSDFSDVAFTSNLYDVNQAFNAYRDIKDSRVNYGKKDFNFSAPYIQSRDAAENLMSWIMKKLSTPRRSVGLEVFGMPIIQLGDIVKIDYDVDSINQVASQDSRFVVYCIENKVDQDGPTTNIYLSEVV